MAKIDVFAEYTSNQRDIFNKTTNEYKSFIKLKFAYVLNKTEELNNQKNFIKERDKKYFIGDDRQIKDISGIFEDVKNLQAYINNLPKYSFAIWFKFKLKTPYFSKDDDEFYIIQNPILKETNFKVPMVRGSSWKGAVAHAFRELLGEKEKIESFLRIFGAGSESIKALESYLFDKSKDLKKTQEHLLEFILFELGLKVDKVLIEKIKKIKNKEEVLNILGSKLSQKLSENKRDLPLEFQTHKGRAIFYPTYFDRLTLEIINPHDRRKRAGTNPIHYEVVPEGTEGIFQLIYIPFDGILKDNNELKNEVNKDLNNLCEAFEILTEIGIGAKTKLGWGRFKIEDKKVCVNSDLEIPERWTKCQD